MQIRPLEQKELGNYLRLLAFLSPTSVVTDPTVTTVWNQVQANLNHTIYGAWSTTLLVGAITVYLEPKFIHKCGSVAHIEDLIVHPEYRGLKIGSKLVAYVKDRLPSQVYKISLNCRVELKPFYEKLGFSSEQSQMVIRQEEYPAPST